MSEIMTNQEQPHGAADPLAARMAASIDNWKRKLLDLTKRNRLLNFRVTKVSTIAVVDELPEEVFRRLYVAEKSMRFKAAPRRANAAEAGNGTSEHSGASLMPTDADEDALIDSHFDGVRGTCESVPYEPAPGDGRHTDEWLQTTLDPESLDRSLRRIEEQARLTVDEQGVNTLFLTLGMLQYTESADSEEAFRSPLIMLPVKLSRKSARSGFELRIGDDDPMVNPALAEYLRRMGVTLPDLAESDAIADDYDLRTYFAELNGQITEKKGWSTASDIYLGLFSFQKFVMFKDLEANAGAIARHRLPRQLVSRSGNGIVGLPEDIRRIELDEEYPPEETFQVVDADSSQLRAMAACARGYDVVIEGPPGTGKSQTITNLIAQALAANRSVLFVAEKMAALNVVQARLVTAGLGEFCLELHSSRANKRMVMRDLATTLDASLQTVATTTVAGARLPAVRTALSEYVNALHEPYGTLGITPYAAFGALGEVRRAPGVPLTRGITDVTQETLHRTIRDLDDLATAAHPVGTPAIHPWRDTTRTFYTEADLEAVATQAGETLNAAEELLSLAAQLQTEFGLPLIRAIEDVDAAMKVGAVLAESPGATLAVLESDAWNAPPPAATSIIELGRELSRLRGVVKGWFRADVLDQDHRDDVAFVQEKAGGTFGFLAIFNGRFRAVRNRWKRYRLPVYSKPILAQADDLKTVDRLLARRAAIRDHDGEAQALFGALWRGEKSDWDALEAYVRWVVDFRRTCVGHGVEMQAYRIATLAAPDTSAFQRVRRAADVYSDRLSGLGKQIGWPSDHLRDVAVTEVGARVQALEEGVDLGPQWAAFERCRQTVSTSVAAEMLPPMLAGAVEPEALSAAFRRAFYMKWLGRAVLERTPLERFASLTHEQRVTEFRDLDRRVLRENQATLIRMLRDGSQERLRTEAARTALSYLQRQIARQRNISPLRRTMKEAGTAIRAIKPCFMMSPMTVAQLLDGSEPVFDVIIFDEASQLPTEDAIGAVIRGRQLVVVGDPKQLPPTNFFAVASGQTVPSVDEDGNPLFEDSESVLEEFMGSGMPMSRLKWHYRSAHESLIRFSNVSFYDADLYTFPSIDTDTTLRGLQFEFVSAGRYEGKGLNAAEAHRVADAVICFARDQIARQERGEGSLSLVVRL